MILEVKFGDDPFVRYISIKVKRMILLVNNTKFWKGLINDLMKPFAAPQRSVKIKMYVNVLSSFAIVTGRVKGSLKQKKYFISQNHIYTFVPNSKASIKFEGDGKFLWPSWVLDKVSSQFLKKVTTVVLACWYITIQGLFYVQLVVVVIISLNGSTK